MTTPPRRARCSHVACHKACRPGRYECPEHDDDLPYGQPIDRNPSTPGGVFGDLPVVADSADLPAEPCLLCHHADHGAEPCEVEVLYVSVDDEPRACGCAESWTDRERAAARPATPDPWLNPDAAALLQPPPF